ncbi:MAG: HD domain-containing protein, partial [Elusimicrobiales bacterium]|nr:HD domain-containing protein [Elusimicrobiales bacterium]
PLIQSAAAERIHEEFSRIFATPVSAAALRAMHKAGLLLRVFPELAPQEKCAEVYYGKGGVLKHTFNVVERMDYLLSRLGRAVSGGKEIAAGDPPVRALKTAALLHDIAKPARAKVVGDRLRFFGHEEHGAAMTEKVMERLRFSRADIRLASAVTAQHLRVGNLAHNDEISDRAIYRFFREMGEYSLPLLLLSWADHSSYVRPADLLRALPQTKKPPFRIPPKGLPRTGLKKTLRFLQVVNMLFRTYLSKGIARRTDRLLDGREIMKAAGVPEGPEIGRLLDQVNLLHFEGRLKSKKDALDWLRKRRK